MTNIYTVGCQRLKLADLQALVSALKIDTVMDWRSKSDARLSPPTLERAFPGKYKFVGDKCNESKFPDNALQRLPKLPGVKLLLFHKEIPGNCPRHEQLAMVLHQRGVEVAHVCRDEVIVAAEYQRSIDDDDAYTCTEWRTTTAPVTAAASNIPTDHPSADQHDQRSG